MKIQHELAAALSAVVKTYACTISRFQGVFNGSSADMYLQFFDAKAVPANGTNAKFEFILFQGAAQFSEWTDLEFLIGCVVAVSTTTGTLTIATGGNTLTGLIEGRAAVNEDDWQIEGDYTTSVDSEIIWTEAAGPKKLVRLEFTPLSAYGSTLYANVLARETGATRVLSSTPLPNNTAVDIWFGQGLIPIEVASNGTLFNACHVVVGEFPYSLEAQGATNFAIKGTYKAA